MEKGNVRRYDSEPNSEPNSEPDSGNPAYVLKKIRKKKDERDKILMRCSGNIINMHQI